MKIYGDSQSGNCYKVLLACALLQIEHDWVHIDILANETQTSAFLAKSPNGKIPVLELENGETLSESNAILNYLCEGSAFYPADSWARAKIHQWQFFEQYSHEPYIAVDNRKSEYLAKQEGGLKALHVMEQQLTSTPYLTGEHPSGADISLFAYTHVAHEGGFSLKAFPSIEQWIGRIKSLPNYIKMPD